MKHYKKKAVLICRSLLGLLLILLVADDLFPFLPTQQVSPEGAALLAAMAESRYLLPLLRSVQLLSGLCLLGGYFTPLALLLFAPLALNSFLFHLVLDPAGLPVAILLLLLEAFLVWAYRYSFEELLQVKAQVW
jgi:uncharacterized membrane protein YphA (DoxX/SURF4 family)